MHSSLFISTTLSLFSLLATAAPTSSTSAPTSSITPAHLPGIPHAPNLHPSQSSQAAANVETRNTRLLEKRNLGMEQLKELMVEIRRDGGGGNKDASASDGSEGDDGDGDHITYILGSPVSFPARGGSGGRNVA